MVLTRKRIERLVMRIQSAFLKDPTLSLTLAGAERRFGIDELTCAGVLGALVEARVLATSDGAYRRRIPRHTVRLVA